ncbi:hypothetical protein SAMN04488056_105245 [Cohaesibacter marisflavi]|uniref:Uncharacterized protein n=1 Tax=Cohaesibacter marisflavi TaxID=655353 RepID=A0A1I5GXP0_9HYPH|nr:hypothetical protein SAMN04488056_105245 [Cohaesibacter marisflavi]
MGMIVARAFKVRVDDFSCMDVTVYCSEEFSITVPKLAIHHACLSPN